MLRRTDQLFAASLKINEPQVVSEEFDGEFVILNLSSGTYYSLQASGNALWAAVTSGVPPQRIVEALEGVGNERASEARSFLERVIELELLRPDTSAQTSVHPAALIDELSRMTTTPAVEVFDDLADLILADPVHDADTELGWPAAKPTSH